MIKGSSAVDLGGRGGWGGGNEQEAGRDPSIAYT